MKKVLLLSVLLLLVANFAIAEGNPQKGKYLFKKTCKLCHGEEMAPLTRTMAQWDDYFKNKAIDHPGDDLKKLPESDLNDINQFLHDYASDSPSPMTCY